MSDSGIVLDLPDGDPLVIAIEHVRWCRRQGMPPAAIISMIATPSSPSPSYDDAVWAVARAQYELSCVRRHHELRQAA